MWQQPSEDETSPQASGMRPMALVGIPESSQLPQWESFSLQDRHLLVHCIVQTARRQVPARPTVDRAGERR